MHTRTLLTVTALALMLGPDPISGQTTTGTWSGTAFAPGLWGGVELALKGPRDSLTATARVVFQGREKNGPVRALTVTGDRISFHVTWWDSCDVRFGGRIRGDTIEGAFGTELDGRPIAGEFQLQRLPVAALPDRFELPAPTGRYRVGRSTYHWVDRSRTAPPGTIGDARELVVHLWYPSTDTGVTIPYLPDLEQLAQVPGALSPRRDSLLRNLRIVAGANAAVAAGTRQFPVVIFSPGQGEKTLFYTALELDLASHGYIVAAVEHPFDAPVVVFPDGRIVREVPAPKVPDGAPQSEIMAALHRTVDYRAADLLFVRRMLAGLAVGTSRFRNRLDLSRTAVIGHSLGGIAAFGACHADAAILACANIDGSYRTRPYPSDGSVGHATQSLLWLRQPTYMFTDGQLQGVGMTRAEFDREIAYGKRQLSGTRAGFDVQLPQVGLNHMDFSDLRLLDPTASPQARASRLLTLEMERDWVRSFLQQAFSGAPPGQLAPASTPRSAHISIY